MSVSVPLEDNFEATLVQSLAASASALTIYLSRVPVCTIPAGKEIVLTLNPGKGFTGAVQQENVLIESIDTVNNTVTVKTGGRAQNRYNGDTPTVQTHSVGTTIILSDPFLVWGALDDFMPLAGGTFTGDVDFSGAGTTLKVPVLTTVQRDALSAENGFIIYNTTEGEFQVYQGGAWSTLASGSTQPNASTTVAGKVEEATQAEVTAGTGTGGTGARLFVNPQSTVVASTGAGDSGKIVKLGTDGFLDPSVIDDSDITVDKITKTGVAGVTTTDKQALSYMGNTRLTQADANESLLNAPWLFAGVASGASTDGNPQTYLPPGPIVTIPAITLAKRQAARLWAGQTQATSNVTTDTISATTDWRAQTFTPSAGEDNVSTVVLNFTKASSPNGSSTVYIYATSGGLPTGAALATSTAVLNSAISSGNNTFVFTTPLSLTPGTVYALVWASGISSGGTLAWNYQNTNPYASGQRCTSSNSGSAWAADSASDFRFQINYRGIAGEAAYLSNTAGEFDLTPGTYSNKVGMFVSTTEVCLVNSDKSLYVTYNFAASSSDVTVDTEITVGFRVRSLIAIVISSSSNLVSVSNGFWHHGLSGGVCATQTYTGDANNRMTATTGAIGYVRYSSVALGETTLSVQAVDENTITIRRVQNDDANDAPGATVYLLLQE